MNPIEISYYLHQARARKHLLFLLDHKWIDSLVYCLRRGYFGNKPTLGPSEHEGPCWPARVGTPGSPVHHVRA